MGYGPLAYVRAIIDLASPFGRKKMAKKADNIREALIRGAGRHRLALVTIHRAKRDHPENWATAAIHQLAHICGIDLVTARVLISEMTTEQMHT